MTKGVIIADIMNAKIKVAINIAVAIILLLAIAVLNTKIAN